MATVQDIITGYGPNFPTLEELFELEANEADELRLSTPGPMLSRYLGSVRFMGDLTSAKAVGLNRFHVIKETFIALAERLEKYSGHHSIITPKLTEDDKGAIRGIGVDLSDIIRAERVEQVADHDTASAVDYIKIAVGTTLPHLEEAIEGFHFATTSEDIMGNVFGLILNDLVYGHVMPAIYDFCDNAIGYVQTHEESAPLVLPALTHVQAAEPTTLGKKVATRVGAIDHFIKRMMENDNFIPFSGKMGGAVGNLTAHYAAYRDIHWESFAEKFVEGLGLTYVPLTDQCVPYAVEAAHFTMVGNMLTQVIKFATDFKDLASSPGHLFVKKKKKGTKGSSIMPNKSNPWRIEGALKMLKEARVNMFHYATELQDYTHEGDMGRSYMLRRIGDMFMPLFTGLQRINRELNQYVPNPEKIDAFMTEYPGMCGSAIQTVLKRERVKGDAYRVIERVSINDDGTYANAQQFAQGLEGAMEELELEQPLREELRLLINPAILTRPANTIASNGLGILSSQIDSYRSKAVLRVSSE